MRRFLTMLTMAMTMTTAMVSTASAVDLRNEDDAERVVVVTSSAMKTRVLLAPKTLAIVICVGTCRFSLDGEAAGVDAGRSEVVTIRGGVLSGADTVAAAR